METSSTTNPSTTANSTKARSMKTRIIRAALVTAVFAGVAAYPLVRAADTPSTQPTASVPATMPTTGPTVSKEARLMLDQMRDAYAAIKSFQMTGTISSSIDIDGQQDAKNFEFASSYAAPNKFRHVKKDGVEFGSTGESGYLFEPDIKKYMLTKAPVGHGNLNELEGDLANAIRSEDLPLALALSDDAARELIETLASVAVAPDVTIQGKTYPALHLSQELSDLTVALDPQTHLIREYTIDMTKLAKARGAQVIKSALFKFDFSVTNIDTAMAADAFAWVPPAGAQEVKAGGDESALAGKPVPPFKLTGMDGKVISNADLKGTVYLLDFWATWCGPCRSAMPGLEKLYHENQAAGFKAFAINQAEEKGQIQKFLDETKFSIPILLDPDAAVGKTYGTDAGIPETVIVGRDGNVLKAFTGTSPAVEEEIRATVAAALKH